jgi:hypothetical protein
MSATTMNLPCTRFVKRVNNGALGSKYSYIAMMADNAKALESAPWHESDVPVQNVTMPVNKVSETDAEYDESGAMTKPPSFSAFTSDGFDCFQQGGDARREDGTMCGYAGCVAYRFKIPSSASSVPLSSVSLTVQRDRYCRAGVRVALALSDEATPSDDWSVVRGEGSGAIVSASTPTDVLGVASWGFLAQSNVPNLVSGRAADGTITFNASGDGGFADLAETGYAYLWVYLTLEDYQAYWTMYNSKESRYYSIEGSAMLVASKSQFTFADDVSADEEEESEGPKYLVHPIPVRVTHYEGYHRTLRPRICFSALSVADGYDQQTSENPLPVKSILLPVATWTIPEGTSELPITHYLVTDGKRIPAGTYIIEAWIDNGGKGVFTPGDPYGCSLKINLSATEQPARIDIELTEVHPGIVRMDISKMIAGMPPASARPEADGNGDVAPYPVDESVFATLAAATDRGRWGGQFVQEFDSGLDGVPPIVKTRCGLPWATIEPAQYPGTSAPSAASMLVRVRVVRNKIRERDSSGSVSFCAVLLDSYLDLSRRAILTEADFIAKNAMPDLDWGSLRTALGGLSLINATYRVVIGDDTVGDYESLGNNLPVVFTNHFYSDLALEDVTPDAELINAEYTGSPTVRWTYEDETGKSYPAFRLRVYTSADKTPSTIVYDSGTVRAPARNSAGVYEWTIPIYVGKEETTAVPGSSPVTYNTHTFAAGTQYYWVVSMLDAVHTGQNNSNTVPFTFAAPAN